MDVAGYSESPLPLYQLHGFKNHVEPRHSALWTRVSGDTAASAVSSSWGRRRSGNLCEEEGRARRCAGLRALTVALWAEVCVLAVHVVVTAKVDQM